MNIRIIQIAGLFMLLAIAVSRPVNAATPSSKITSKSAVAVPLAPVSNASGVVEKKQEYLLPFPGILPDHPLYFLKQVRDGIMDRLIVDSIRKAEFLILQADKRLNMGNALIAQNKEKLAEITVSKGEKYLERAVSGLGGYKSMGRSVPASMTDKLTRSMEKHVEVLTGMIESTTEPAKSGLRGTLEFVKNLQGEVEKLK